jgi:GntP family gluconate:H+ symporter
MYGMPIAQALVFLGAVIVILAATQWRHIHAFVAITVVAALFGFIAGFPTSILGRFFGTGFSDAIYSPGLVIVAAALIAGIGESTGASDRLAAVLEAWRIQSRWLGVNKIAAALGLLAGIGTSPAPAFALLTPLLRPLGGKSRQQHRCVTLTLALAISGSHGLIALTPISIAAIAIVDADWLRVALIGLPLAVIVTACGTIYAQSSVAGYAAETSAAPYPPPVPDQRSGGLAFVLCLAALLPLAMLMFQSVGNIPSEPLGGGPTRELILGIGRPLMLFLAGLGIMVIGQPRRSLSLIADTTWTSRVFGNVAGLLLIVCAAGGLQRLCQETGMATLLAERALDWQVGAHVGALAIVVPFFVAAVLKTLQGSPLVAAITAAGMVQPSLVSLGLGGANGKALAALAIGAGAMTIAHVNDDYFWLVADRAGLAPWHGIKTFSFGTLLQGLVALALLLILSLLIGNS